MKTIWRAGYDSRHFSFEAYADTKDGAIAALILGLRRHGGEYAIAEDWWMEGYEGVPTDEIFEVHEYELGVAYRDHEPLRAR